MSDLTAEEGMSFAVALFVMGFYGTCFFLTLMLGLEMHEFFSNANERGVICEQRPTL